MTYQEAVHWLFSQFPVYQQIGKKAYKPDLSNTIMLCATLEIPFQELTCIHVAGTNGKGSTSNYLASILTENGERVGLFTSPHIVDFRERIRCNGEMISEEEVIDFCLRVQQVKWEISPSFFEITWCMALEFFLARACTISVIETGLGGRLDSTNIVTPILSIITNIGLDHKDILGDTKELIAAEKAGIIKSNCPVLIGERDAKTENVFKQKAQLEKTNIYFSDEFSFDSYQLSEGYPRINEHTVRAAVSLLNQQGFDINEKSIQNGFLHTKRNTGFFGRFQLIQKQPLTIIDVAHNCEGIQALLNTLKPIQQGKLFVLYGTSSDKDISSILRLFPKETRFIFTEFSNSRSATIEQLEQVSSELGIKGTFFKNFSDAYSFSQQIVNKEDTLVLTGSFFLISDFF